MKILPQQLREYLGNIDVYFLDQILKGRIQPGMRVLDAGCGGGRNLIYLMRAGIEVYGTDQQQVALQVVQELAHTLAPELPKENFRLESVEDMSFEDGYFDFVICNAVLHFSRDRAHFEAMVTELLRVLKPGGILFARLASDIGIEGEVKWIQGRRAHLPDGSQRFLVDLAMLQNATEKLGGKLIEPIKTVNVQQTRCMTNWVLRKGD